MNFVIRDARGEDMMQVLDLIKELALFVNEPDAVILTEEDLCRDGFGENPLFHCFVAESNMKIIGMALIYPRYSTWKGMTVHLEDLIVKEEARGYGIGSKLFGEVIKYGKNLGVKRIEWAVLDWNEPAINFYEKNGAHVLRECDAVQLDEKGIDNFISSL